MRQRLQRRSGVHAVAMLRAHVGKAHFVVLGDNACGGVSGLVLGLPAETVSVRESIIRIYGEQEILGPFLILA